jgi:hypothetical protein
LVDGFHRVDLKAFTTLKGKLVMQLNEARKLHGGVTRAGLLSLFGLIMLAVMATGIIRGNEASLASTPMSPTLSLSRKCVGVFVVAEKRTIAADTRGLRVLGRPPCGERGVAAWATQGVYRVFDDGAVEFLASPVPPCPDGEVYVWIQFPNNETP